MTPLVVNSRVGKDGVLRLDWPLGPGGAETEVKITVEPLKPAAAMTPEQWRGWVASLAGSWQGDFERMPQGEFESRETLS